MSLMAELGEGPPPEAKPDAGHGRGGGWHGPRGGGGNVFRPGMAPRAIMGPRGAGESRKMQAR